MDKQVILDKKVFNLMADALTRDVAPEQTFRSVFLVLFRPLTPPSALSLILLKNLN